MCLVAVTEFNSLYLAMKLALSDGKTLLCLQHRLHCSNLDKYCASCGCCRHLCYSVAKASQHLNLFLHKGRHVHAYVVHSVYNRCLASRSSPTSDSVWLEFSLYIYNTLSGRVAFSCLRMREIYVNGSKVILTTYSLHVQCSAAT